MFFSITDLFLYDKHRNIWIGLSAITVDQINNLDDTEFTDCIDISGSVTDYSTDQIDALVTVGKRNTVSYLYKDKTHFVEFIDV